MIYHYEPLEEVFKALNANGSGLTQKEAEHRLEKQGRNALAGEKKKSLPEKIWEQIKDPMVLVLIAAAVVSGLLGEAADMSIILAVVILNTVIGLTQESKAEQAVEALKKMSAQSCKVLRDGHVTTIDSELLVPGDVVVLDAGDMIPADLRLTESSSLKIEEASLTGESVPSEKNAAVQIEKDAPLGDRTNMAYSGTGVTYGRAKGIVYATGMETEIGKIAHMLNKTEQESTPLQKKLAEVSKMLTVGVIFICILIFGVIMFKAGHLSLDIALDAFMIAVSLAVAAIPEGLTVVVTIVMAIGVTRMAARKAIIKKLPAVETLGCAEIICSDKTGTLTQNIMDVRMIYTEDASFEAKEYIEKSQSPILLDILYLCNDSEITETGQEIGDPTETCLKRYTLKKYAADRFNAFTRIQDLPFDSERKMMSTVNQMPQGPIVMTKGAPDEILKKCSRILVNGQEIVISEAHKEKIMAANHAMAEQALRVLGAAYKPYTAGEELEKDLIFTGLTGMMDPPRPEAYEAIQKCKKAGITTIMITGDHKDTAVAIAKELDIIDDPSQAVFGSVLDNLSDEELDKILPDIRVYARVSPQHKVRIVEGWKRKGKIVAMTGDGVNDAPALKISDIGVGMGITGTEVSKGAADMLLSDDNFATIVNAVEEGRKIYTNIRKAVQFLLSTNVSEVVALFIATLLLPSGTVFLGAVHILWINLVTDSIPAIGLGMNNGEAGVMEQPPRESSASIFSGGVGFRIIYQGILLAALTLCSYFIGTNYSPETGTTMAFLVLSMLQTFHSFNIKSGDDTALTKESFDNPTLLVGTVLPIILFIIILNVPFIAGLFKVVPLTLGQWGISLGLAFSIIPIQEIIKVFGRKIK